MYPQFGLGTVSEVTEKQVNGSNLAFYRLEFTVKQMEILVRCNARGKTACVAS